MLKHFNKLIKPNRFFIFVLNSIFTNCMLILVTLKPVLLDSKHLKFPDYYLHYYASIIPHCE